MVGSQMIHLKCILDIEKNCRTIFFENQSECTILLKIKTEDQLRKILIIEPNERLNIYREKGEQL